MNEASRFQAGQPGPEGDLTRATSPASSTRPTDPDAGKLRLPMAVLISGGGTTLENLIRCATSGQLAVAIRMVVCSNPSARGLEIARSAGIETRVVTRSQCASPEAFRDAVFSPCREVDAQLVVMGGFLKHVLIPDDFENRVINIHPSLIPQFCGKGFYGARVHAAVLESGVPQTGCTVHLVDDEFDHGPILLQRVVPVMPEDTVATLGARVFQAECEALPAAIEPFVRAYQSARSP